MIENNPKGIAKKVSKLRNIPNKEYDKLAELAKESREILKDLDKKKEKKS